jgi:hypothetical protein
MVADVPKVIKSKKFNEHVYWVFFKFIRKVAEEQTEPSLNIEAPILFKEDEGWSFLTVPALIVSQQQLRFYQAQIAKEGGFDGCLIKSWTLVISR